jgi:hypothetical protein
MPQPLNRFPLPTRWNQPPSALERGVRQLASVKVGHPGLAESFIPVWGSGREALADLQDGNYLGAAFNGAMAVTDLIPAAAVGKAVYRGKKLGELAAKLAEKRAAKAAAGKHVGKDAVDSWANYRRWREDKKYHPGKEMHHAFIPNRMTFIPGFIRHSDLNLTPLSREMHARIHGSFKDLPRYNRLQQYWVGTPEWAKVAKASALGHVETAREVRDRQARPAARPAPAAPTARAR